MMDLNSFFNIIYVITIERNRRRQVEIKSLLESKGIDFDFFLGFDGEDLNIDDLEKKGFYSRKLNLLNCGQLLTLNELGCGLSHRAIYAEILNKRYEKVLILEDDVTLITSNIVNLTDSLMNVPNDWQLLYLGYCKNNMKMPISFKLKCAMVYPLLNLLNIKKIDVRQVRNIYRRPFNKYWDLAGFFNGAYAYGLSRIGAEKILREQSPLSMASDVALKHMVMKGKIRAYSMVYEIFDARWDIGSSIGMRPSWKN